MQSSQTNSSWKLFKQLLADYRQHRILLVTAISCILLEAISDLMVAAVLKTGVDSITSGSFAQLLEAGILFAVITLAAAAVIFIRRLALGRFGEQIGAENAAASCGKTQPAADLLPRKAALRGSDQPLNK